LVGQGLTLSGSAVGSAGLVLECPCFAAGTLVSTAEGQKPIETIREGDLVWARDPAAARPELKRIVKRYVTPAKELVVVLIEREDGSLDSVRVTPGHPFWVERRGWVPAQELNVGDELSSSSTEKLHVAGGFSLPDPQTVYNFEVDGWHSFFVGESGILVHNGCNCFGVSGLPEGPGIYHVEADGRMYTGSAFDVSVRLNDPTHPAGPLLMSPNRRVSVWSVDVGTASTTAEKQHVLRFFEQQMMDIQGNTPGAPSSLNVDRATAAGKMDARVPEVDSYGASISGTETKH
jgi:hypothetical protein